MIQVFGLLNTRVTSINLSMTVASVKVLGSVEPPVGGRTFVK